MAGLPGFKRGHWGGRGQIGTGSCMTDVDVEREAETQLALAGGDFAKAIAWVAVQTRRPSDFYAKVGRVLRGWMPIREGASS